MKKIILLMIVLLFVSGGQVFAKHTNLCKYMEGNTHHSFDMTPGQSAEEYCKTWSSDFWQRNGKYNECLSQDYPMANRAYQAGACKKYVESEVYYLQGCECEIKKLEDGTNAGYSCSGSSGCNASKAMQELRFKYD